MMMRLIPHGDTLIRWLHCTEVAVAAPYDLLAPLLVQLRHGHGQIIHSDLAMSFVEAVDQVAEGMPEATDTAMREAEQQPLDRKVWQVLEAMSKRSVLHGQVASALSFLT